MAKQIKQYRFYADGALVNQPAGLTALELSTGSIFETQIVDLRIQSYPGTKFYLNDSDDWIMIGSTGEYHLGLAGNYEITALRFDADFLNTYFNSGNPDAYLIVDIVYNSTKE